MKIFLVGFCLLSMIIYLHTFLAFYSFEQAYFLQDTLSRSSMQHLDNFSTSSEANKIETQFKTYTDTDGIIFLNA